MDLEVKVILKTISFLIKHFSETKSNIFNFKAYKLLSMMNPHKNLMDLKRLMSQIQALYGLLGS